MFAGLVDLHVVGNFPWGIFRGGEHGELDGRFLGALVAAVPETERALAEVKAFTVIVRGSMGELATRTGDRYVSAASAVAAGRHARSGGANAYGTRAPTGRKDGPSMTGIPELRALAAIGAALVFINAGGCRMAEADDNDIAPRIAPTGTLRAAINYGNIVLAQKGPDGEPAGISADLARELGRRLELPVSFTTYDTAGKVVDALNGPQTWDVAFLAIDPKRAQTIGFTPPYVIIEGAYMVPKGSALTENDQVDRPGTRIAVGRNTAYDLYLARTLTSAERVFAPTSQAALELFLRDRLDVVASVRQPLELYARDHADVRVLPGRFMVIEQALAAPRGRDEALAYLARFVEEMKASGFVAAALARSGQHDAAVAPKSNVP